MLIEKVKIKNFRLLNDISLDLEENISLVIGKNNTGKTSLLILLEKFLNNKSSVFNIHDFSISLQKKITSAIEKEISLEDYQDFEIQLRLEIKYDEEDNIQNLSKYLLDLNPSHNIFVLSFSYSLNYEYYKKLLQEYAEYKQTFDSKSVIDFLGKNHKKYFFINKEVVDANDEGNKISISEDDISEIIALKSISAKRDVSNEESSKESPKKPLSSLSYKYFKSTKSGDAIDVTSLQKNLLETDDRLNEDYNEIFKDIREKIKRFSYSETDAELEIKSNLEEFNILKDNTSVVYKQSEQFLPEDYNGLGYLNLFSMIFNLHIIIESLKKNDSSTKSPSDINLLFIEEPEAHTHPQMQYVFINKIKDFLSSEKEGLNCLQTVISTHSAHIASQSDFDDIKYFLKCNDSIIVKNLSELKMKYMKGDDGRNRFNFLKQYLTLNKSELFFSDKVIFIEGDTERILLPAMMRKVDLENQDSREHYSLLSQNISVVELGNYAHIFDDFLEYIGSKALVITDLDSVKSDRKAHPVDDSEKTSNPSIIDHFIKFATYNIIMLTYRYLCI